MRIDGVRGEIFLTRQDAVPCVMKARGITQAGIIDCCSTRSISPEIL